MQRYVRKSKQYTKVKNVHIYRDLNIIYRHAHNLETYTQIIHTHVRNLKKCT
jgi:hypothetical protein